MTEAQRNIIHRAVVEWLATHPSDLRTYEEETDYAMEEVKKMRKIVWLFGCGLGGLMFALTSIEKGECQWQTLIFLPFLVGIMEWWYRSTVKNEERRCRQRIREAKELMHQ